MKHERSWVRACVWVTIGVACCLDPVSASAEAPGQRGREERKADTPLARAKALTDRMVAIVKANPAADWPTLSKRLRAEIQGEPLDELSPEEVRELDAYVKQATVPVRATLDRLRARTPLPPPPAPVAGPTTCFTFCILFWEFACETGQPFANCVGMWDCTAGIGGHTCVEDGEVVGGQDPCGDDGVCPPGFRCARWAFKKDECVKTCDDDADCPGNQKCKKPFGTNFWRCK